ncbi:partial Inner membrane protein YbcI, partial [Gammaproteobacteria bacterium]
PIATMPTVFSHPLVPLALGIGMGKKTIPSPLLKLGILVSILPDFDALAFTLGIPYASQLGHRGFSHSLVTAILVALGCCLFHRQLRASRWSVFWFCALSMASHPLLDALTDGGLGVALFWPFSNKRYFFPWATISVSPIGMGFFSIRGWEVLKSEIYSVWLPCIALGLVLFSGRVTLCAMTQSRQTKDNPD